MNKTIFRLALLAGIIVGFLDAAAACINAYLQRGVTPQRVFRYIASGVFGKEALAGGLPMAAWGALFHFTIAIGWTLLFFLAYARLKILQKNKFIVGLAYGIFVWLGMNLVVLPLSNVPTMTYRLVPTVIMIGIHMFVIGLSISLLANQFLSKKIQS